MASIEVTQKPAPVDRIIIENGDTTWKLQLTARSSELTVVLLDKQNGRSACWSLEKPEADAFLTAVQSLVGKVTC